MCCSGNILNEKGGYGRRKGEMITSQPLYHQAKSYRVENYSKLNNSLENLSNHLTFSPQSDQI